MNAGRTGRSQRLTQKNPRGLTSLCEFLQCQALSTGSTLDESRNTDENTVQKRSSREFIQCHSKLRLSDPAPAIFFCFFIFVAID
ncbi:C-C motif chemokine [Trichinella spiralis]|uniref:C-C motif chemokine n=1 Tax=Trichinella spiralis TaxID=6334 RepID=A0ABR3KYW2_TRISP